MSVEPGSARNYNISELDRTEYIRSQMASYPEYADRLADEMFKYPNTYPVFVRDAIPTGFEEADPPRVREGEEGFAEYQQMIANGEKVKYATFRPGPVKFVGWMAPRQYDEWLVKRQAEREARMNDG